MNRTSTVLSAAACVVCSAVAAESLDAQRPVLCAATTVFVCEPQAGCVTGAPGAVNLPTFWRVDPSAKSVASRGIDGVERASAIEVMALEKGRVVISGSDEGFAWSGSIDARTGKMLLSGGRDVGYLVFGECTVP